MRAASSHLPPQVDELVSSTIPAPRRYRIAKSKLDDIVATTGAYRRREANYDGDEDNNAT